MPQKNRIGLAIKDNLQNKINRLPRTIVISPFITYALDKIADELLKDPELKPENFSIRVIKQLPLIENKEAKKTTKKT